MLQPTEIRRCLREVSCYPHQLWTSVCMARAQWAPRRVSIGATLRCLDLGQHSGPRTAEGRRANRGSPAVMRSSACRTRHLRSRGRPRSRSALARLAIRTGRGIASLRPAIDRRATYVRGLHDGWKPELSATALRPSSRRPKFEGIAPGCPSNESLRSRTRVARL